MKTIINDIICLIVFKLVTTTMISRNVFTKLLQMEQFTLAWKEENLLLGTGNNDYKRIEEPCKEKD